MSTISNNAGVIRKVAAQLEAWGWPSVFVSGWETRQNHQEPLPWNGVTVHHTGGTATSTSYMIDPKDRPDLVVLCNAHITRDHKIKFVAAGGASHAGNGYKPNYDKTVAGKAPMDTNMVPGSDGTFSANRPTFGIEVDGGGGVEWDEWMLGAVVATAAAFHVVNGWKESSPRVMAHKEFTKRKPGDPAINMGQFRTLVKEFIAKPYPQPGVMPPVLGSRILSKDGNDSGPDVVELIDLLIKNGYKLTNDGLFGPAVDTAVRDFQSKNKLDVDGLVGPSTITALKNDPVPEPQPEPEPKPEPKPSKVSKVRFMTFNTLDERFGPEFDGRLKAVVASIKSGKPNIVALTETPEDARNKIRAKLDGGTSRWLTWVNNATALIWDSTVLEHVGPPKTPDWGYHGAVLALFKVKATGQLVVFGSYHLKPNSISTDTTQKKEIAEVAKVARGIGDVRIIGGDGIDDINWLSEWDDARTVAKTSSTRNSKTYKKGGITDKIFADKKSSAKVTIEEYNVLSGSGSDHYPVITVLTITETNN